ncbi:MAG: DNA starvation/stationary phase protection protein [Paenibacillus sp.]|uniref:Dps family protein n=1 Tax=Paenibacillus sp. TaxID=58172 RepID=UPI0025CD0050|nr:DNA starvation/stationary phase protection protein [Paenibacillus sp.]MBR2564459.1 DNA starvation/stationary phase protection protein [Paenibacillus sp.]
MSTIQTKQNTTTNTSALQESLNRQIAGWSVLYTKLHNFHWYVKGPHFFTLHAKFEVLYNLTTANMDEVAERLLMIGGRPVATIAEQLHLSPIAEVQGQLSAEQMVEQVIADLNAMLSVIHQGIYEAGEAEDNATEDILIGFTAALDKEIWMLNAFLGK